MLCSDMIFALNSGTPLVRPPLYHLKSGLLRGGISSGVEINIFMFRFTVSSGLSRGVGLSSGWPLKRGSNVLYLDHIYMYRPGAY